ncbi:hypothetical protein H2199_004380 [Coniosporium tulheliwenetii]|uniref:Uncharacterized protein n=1 Tax=Coniosporium tulheliwenetii TaxID=3383036 RepID=A0ACC2Z5E3_9PEZI|nr:hypothetical protein H2199_004380 [Cladosporium sp. JES 115]
MSSPNTFPGHLPPYQYDRLRSEKSRGWVEKAVAAFRLMKRGHEPVDPALPVNGRAEIRLLELQPGIGSDPLTCKIFTTSLSKASEYECLSYTWGDSAFYHDIVIEEQRRRSVLKVTSNLRSALQRLRLQHQSRRLWIDQICINQKSIPERNKQVTLMRYVYWNAQHCVVDLGEEEERTAPAFERAMTVEEELGCANVDDPESGSQIPKFHSVELAGIIHLFSLPWFRRVWVFQEVVLAANVSVLYGTRSITWAQLYALYESFVLYVEARGTSVHTYHELGVDSASLEYMATTTHMVDAMEELRRTGNTLPQRIITELLRDTISMDATDPRDKVYGLLGLVAGDYGLDIQPDYAKTPAAVYQEFARLALDKGDMEILSDAGDNNHSIVGLPSWAPDWTARPYSRRLWPDIYSACGIREHSKVDSSPIDPSRIHIRGGIVGTVRAVSRSWLSASSSTLAEIAALEIEQRALVEDLEIYPTGEDIVEAYWRTLVSDAIWRDGRRMRVPPEWAENYQVYRSCCEMVHRDHLADIPTAFREQFLEYHSRAFGKLCVTHNGYIGNAPHSTLPGDKICFFYGSRVPFVLREEGASYRIIGDCYIHGLMNGEAFELDHWRDEMISLC